MKIAMSFIGACLALAAGNACAQERPLLHPLFQDHAVLQRDRPMRIHGWAKPGAGVTVTLAGKSQTAKAGKDGAWSVGLPAMPAGGPYDMSVKATDGQAADLHDLLIGDVFLCSGQSNMQFTIAQSRNAADEISKADTPNIRYLHIDRRGSPQLRDLPLTPVKWVAASRQTAADFSAVCYFFGREIAKTHNVPVGLIHSSWGGSVIQDWLPAEALKKVGGFDDNLKLLDAYAKDPKTAEQIVLAGTVPWAEANDPGTKDKWYEAGLDDGGWGEVWLPRVWEDQGRDDLNELDGVVWFRKYVTLTAEQAAASATLNLATVDERDTTFVNGVKVGETLGPAIKRAYAIPAGVLKAGDNVIAVRAIDESGGGGLRSTPEEVFLAVGNDKLPLAGTWKYKVAVDFRTGAAHPPFVPWVPTRGNTNLYNAMIAPVETYGYTGVLWFQGEQNTGQSQLYAKLLPEMIRGWRQRTGQPLPFLIAQLTGYGAMTAEPGQSGFAEIREVQRLTAKALPRTGLAVTIDLGNPRDIHSPEKQEVAHRLALEANRVIYGKEGPASPFPASAVRESNTIRIRFDHVGRGLISYSGTAVLGFEACGQTCAFVPAKIDGDTVVLDAPKDATRVRYAWAGTPIVNLYNRDGLPASPFELPVK
ncbi:MULTISPECIES: sialate O-acetylesterase [Asticcacaulis]|uniref:sialate O-acetylesterase n=1 Tax=Asticcacaulis TaxID=76890 RepID=UPI001AE98EE0|nr:MULTISPECIES: sialate O-acetylesterase [Asticcacaulis]MBP2160808.1 sialate O-acetylesterase [Asticcacaulis solisilvae]MDR6801988.1 sialate O-acetylesterase [Asticcacaulis sp. BE141]